ncbi:MAG: nucleotide exchange factor GrpE [Bacteroidetes bacterium]|nr:nucleotide exchange factor GrpE [Bacteroidota bacterium]MCW5894031.1 nucleotide exchange factor GrpE [Bacteroidota bacterium]
MAEDLTHDENIEHTSPETDPGNGVPTEGTPHPSELDQLKLKIEELQAQVDSFKDQLLRKAAEFENYKRRTEADSINLIKNANEGLIVSLLPILNDFMRSLKAGAENRDYDAFYKGVELIHNKFSKILELQGLVPFDSVGKPFDVEYHDALLQMPKEGVPPHTVIEEVERGYKLNERVLRHAKVIVSAPSQVEESAANNEEVKA